MGESSNSQHPGTFCQLLERWAKLPISGSSGTPDARQNEALLDAIGQHLGLERFAPLERLLRTYAEIRVADKNPTPPQLHAHVEAFNAALCDYASPTRDPSGSPVVDQSRDRKLLRELQKRRNAVRFYRLNTLLEQFAGLEINPDTGDARDRGKEKALLAEVWEELDQWVRPTVDAVVNRRRVFWIEREEAMDEFYARFLPYLRRKRAKQEVVVVSAVKFLRFFVQQAIHHPAKDPLPIAPDAGPPVPDLDPLPRLSEGLFDRFVESMKTTFSRRCTGLSDPNAGEEHDATLRLGALLFLPSYQPETGFAAHFGISNAGKNRLKLYWAEFMAGAFHDILEKADMYVPRQVLTIGLSRKGTYGPWISHCFIFCWNECADTARGQLLIDPAAGCKALHRFWLFSSGQTENFQPLGGFFVEIVENPPPAYLVSYRNTGPQRGLVLNHREDGSGER